MQEAVAALGELSIEARYAVCDVSDPKSVEALADFAWDTFGHVDVLLNNAGITAPHFAAPDLPLEELHKIFGVNFFGVWHGAAVFGKRMIDQGTPASIYNLGSEHSFFGAVPNATAYLATKHAVLGLTEGLRSDLPDFIDVGIVVPGFVQSEMHASGVNKMGMNTDQFVEIAMKQIRLGEFYVVTHAYNIEHINARHTALSKAFDTYAPRYEGDDEYDVKSIIRKMRK